MSVTTDRKALTEQLARQTAEAERLAGTFKVDEKGRFSIDTDQYRAYKAAVQNAKEIKSVLDGMTAVDELRTYLDAPEDVPAAAQGLAGGTEVKSLGQLFVESDDFRRYAEDGGELRGRLMAAMEGKSIYNLSGGEVTHQALGQAENLGIAEQARRKFHVRDLFPKSTTKAAVLYGVREIGFTNAADFVAQRSADGTAWVKAPESKLRLESVMYPVAEIAHWTDAHKNILADEPRLKSFINTRMVEGVKEKEDYELLFGAGGAEKVTGIANTAGVQQYAGLAADKYSIQIRRAITKALLAEYNPTGLVISPTRWEDVEIETDDTGAFRVAVAVAVGAEKKIWRLNVVETTAMNDANFLIGAFGMGAQLHDRESVKVEVSTETGDSFIEGRVVVKASERVALEVPRPESFVLGTFTAPAAPAA